MIQVVDIKTENLLQEAKRQAQVAANNNEKSIYVYQIHDGAFVIRFTPIPPESNEQYTLCDVVVPTGQRKS